MSDSELVALLQWALPRLGLRWAGYRRVRRQVEKRVRRRVADLALEGIAAYRERLAGDPAEWEVLRGLCGVTISRFYRDAALWDALRDQLLPALADAARAAGQPRIACWSLGCASGEEPYTLAITWKLALAQRYPELHVDVLATDVDEHLLSRAERAEYREGSLRELPAAWRDAAFERDGELYRLRAPFRRAVQLQRQDVRLSAPAERFDLILCRNSVFSYFDEAHQRQTLEAIVGRLATGGFLLLGKGERLPVTSDLQPWNTQLGIHQRAPRAIHER